MLHVQGPPTPPPPLRLFFLRGGLNYNFLSEYDVDGGGDFLIVIQEGGEVLYSLIKFIGN